MRPAVACSHLERVFSPAIETPVDRGLSKNVEMAQMNRKVGDAASADALARRIFTRHSAAVAPPLAWPGKSRQLAQPTACHVAFAPEQGARTPEPIFVTAELPGVRR